MTKSLEIVREVLSHSLREQNKRGQLVMVARLGYRISVGFVDLVEIGVPQTRRRLILVGSKKMKIIVENIQAKYQIDEKRTVKWAITKPGFSEELMDKIRDIHMDFNAIQDGLISVSGVTINSNVCLTIQQCSQNDCFMDSLRKVLSKREIAYSLYQFDLPPAYTCRNTSDLIENGYL